jgi:predicted nucleotidyltransferase
MIRKADWRLAERLKGSLLEHNIPLYKLIVFSSRACGDAGPESDLDVLVLVEHVDAALRKTISHCAWALGLRFRQFFGLCDLFHHDWVGFICHHIDVLIRPYAVLCLSKPSPTTI